MPTYTAPSEDEGKRSDVVLSFRLKGQRTRIQALIKEGAITKNGQPFKSHALVQAGDVFTYPEVLEAQTVVHQKATPPVLEIIYQDADLVVINKPAGLLVHPTGPKETKTTVVDGMLALFPEIAGVGDSPIRPGIVHRLDKDVSGVMVIARSQKTFDYLKAQFAGRSINKEYLALAYGHLPKDHDIITLKIGRSKTRKRMVARPESQEGKEAATEYDVLTRYKTTTLARVHTLTGRTHQIRAHFKGIGHPLVGDPLYIRRYMRHIKPIPLGRVFLHAATLAIPLPDGTTKTFEAPLPEELARLLTTLPIK